MTEPTPTGSALTCACLDALLERLDGAPHDKRLAILKQAAVAHGGGWDLPADTPGIYEPALPSISVLGITAFAASVDELPRNWMRAARNALAWEDREDCV